MEGIVVGRLPPVDISMVWLTTLTGWVLLIANFLRHGLRSSSRWLTSSSSPSKTYH